jgi:uncharacterized protein YqjF (DUF2071 family)
VRISLAVCDLVLVSWAVAPEAARRDLPRGLEPALDDDGRAVVSLVGFRNAAVRLAGVPAPGFSQLNLRTYVHHGDDAGIHLLSLRVTPGGLGGALLGVPVRPARIRVRPGAVSAPGLGVSLRYRVGETLARVPEVGGVRLGAQRTAFVESAGLRAIATDHEPFAWRAAELTAAPRVDAVLALGFDVGEPDSVLAAPRTAFRFDLPPKAIP